MTKLKDTLEAYRKNAITCTELTKGFTHEQRTNTIKAIDELSGDIQVLVNQIPIILEDFLRWYDKLSPAEKCTVWPPAGSGSGTGLYNMETKDIVDKFLQENGVTGEVKQLKQIWTEI